MIETKQQLDAALAAVHEADLTARAHRRRAGLLLAERQEQYGDAYLQGTGLDERTAALLIEMACGGQLHQVRRSA